MVDDNFEHGSFLGWGEIWGSLKGGSTAEVEEDYFTLGTPVTLKQFENRNFFEIIKAECLGLSINTSLLASLELGCGRGTISLYLNKLLGCKTVLLDARDEALILARRLFTKHNGEGLFLRGYAEDTGLKSESFDLTFSVGLCEHFSDVFPIIAEKYRLLKKNGVMVSFNVPDKKSINDFSKYYRVLYRNAIYLHPRNWYAFLVKMQDKMVAEKRPKGNNLANIFKSKYDYNYYEALALRAGFRNVRTFGADPLIFLKPMPLALEKQYVQLYRMIFLLRTLLYQQQHPFACSYKWGYGHFLIGYK